MEDDVGLIKAPRMCHMVRGDKGYGFNLHGEKGVVGQYISAVDRGGPADNAGICIGDRVVEVNSVNVETLSHAEVVNNIRAIPDKTSLLVVDKITDNYLRKIGHPVTADLVNYSSVHEIKISGSGEKDLNSTSDTDAVDEVTDEPHDDLPITNGDVIAELSLSDGDGKEPEESASLQSKPVSANEPEDPVSVEDPVVTQESFSAQETASVEEAEPSFPTYESVPQMIATTENTIPDQSSEVTDMVDGTAPSVENKDTTEPVNKNNVNNGDVAMVHTHARPASVPKRKQVKQTKTDWKAKQDLFNNL
ncbi:Na(+)/H(+) exchange regulatory cofactor NHE-RF2-like [Hydractinia symbiolongicarpus]|uniref:Na(+)/H(+) exchange regulatory cofactor NHE-RF2-like n=1 Tax=Hydractinia symbiolongicarpus TaxID=13093 RepID=UPI00254DC95A|nr:Na(+)/H(+) exchange regulatory cofactor NHE-RF2-like [Hydractinia symbiolongicarpus]